MRSQLFVWGGLAAFVALSAGCSSPAGNPYAAPAPPSAGSTLLLSEQEIVSARKLYVAKCAKCHKFHNPANYTDAEWRAWMRKMSRKSKLKSEQEELLSRYLDSFRNRSPEERR
jgi:hypothetical protein